MKQLWYNKAASSWNEALPLGNGRLGAMVYGATDFNKNSTEIIQLNEDTLWVRPEVECRINPDAKEYLPKVRDLLMKGDILPAEMYAKAALMATPKYQTPYQTLGELHLFFDDHRDRKPENYRRELDLETAVMNISYELGDVLYKRELFISAEDQVMMMKLSTSKKNALTFTAHLSRKTSGPVYKCDDKSVALEGSAGAKGVNYASIISAESVDGKVYAIGDHLMIEGATEVTLYLSAKTDYYGENPLEVCKKQLRDARMKSYKELKERHIKEYSTYFNRVDFNLDVEKYNHLPTNERLEGYKENKDMDLASLYFHYGRYLLISCSRPGTKAANLQGIWNDMLLPPWDSKYTININTEMNYWPAEICNLSECHEPLFDLLEGAIDSGRKTAREMYGCKGFVIHHNIDGFGDTAPVDASVSSTIWPMGGAWLSLHLWEHYRYTGDTTFLRDKALPIIKEAIEFFMDYLVEDEDGRLLSGPSISPENCYIHGNGNTGYLCMAPAMDNQILHELYTAYIKGAKVIGGDDAFCQEVKTYLDKLPELKIGKDGRIMEWMNEFGEKEPGHRHISHLFALYPGNQISPIHTPEFSKAAKKTLYGRLQNGGGHTGWSRAWIINFWARLLDAEKALMNIGELFRTSTLPNLLDNHPPFQIDGNFGATAAMVEMLMQSSEEEIHILPSLPTEWSKGSIKGIKTVGGYEIHMEWANGKLETLNILSPCDGSLNIRYGDEVHTFTVSKGKNKLF